MEPMDLTYCYDPEVPADSPFAEAGVSVGSVVIWSGEPGPAICIPAALMSDGEGRVFVTGTGEARPVTITD